tara:strand:- start:277 stop:477 length:201 start_codon:yes stop_codon:yes gene_type:complete
MMMTALGLLCIVSVSVLSIIQNVLYRESILRLERANEDLRNANLNLTKIIGSEEANHNNEEFRRSH